MSAADQPVGQSAGQPADQPEDVLVREGKWEIHAGIYFNGRRVASADGTGATYLDAVEVVGGNLERGDLDRRTSRVERHRAHQERLARQNAEAAEADQTDQPEQTDS